MGCLAKPGLRVPDVGNNIGLPMVSHMRKGTNVCDLRLVWGAHGRARWCSSFIEKTAQSIEIQSTSLQRGPHDGMDRPALPVLPSPADASRAHLHRDDHDRRGA